MNKLDAYLILKEASSYPYSIKIKHSLNVAINIIKDDIKKMIIIN